MIDVTDRHCRYFLRLLSKNTRLYTEMITCPAIIHGDQEYLLAYDQSEHPLAIQLGGSKPEEFAYCAQRINEFAYDEININVGCPSERVQSGKFGAILMKEPELVRDCFLALKENSNVPITIKSRIGVDECDSDDFLHNFVSVLTDAGCKTFIIHARIALLSGLSPKENRNIPPLNYDRVRRLKKNFPELTIILNGGIQSLDDVSNLCQEFDGVMLGREITRNPFLLTSIDEMFFGASPSTITRSEALEYFIPYMEKQLDNGIRAHSMARHLIGLYHLQKFSRQWRQLLSSNTIKSSEDFQYLLELARKLDIENQFAAYPTDLLLKQN